MGIEIVGQHRLLKQLENLTLDSFPHTSLLLGEKGCGKHLISQYISENILHLPLINCTEYISDEYIDQVYRTTNPAIYTIDLTQFTEVKQNIILKFSEEPLKNAFVILLAENTNMLLDTISNRCRVFEFEAYTKQELMTFISEDIDKELVAELLRTPGRILDTNLSNILEMKEVCDKMINKISKANLSNALTIGNKINFSDQFDKFDLQVFLDLLSSMILSAYASENSTTLFSLYELTLDIKKKLVDKRVNAQLAVQNFLTSFWKISKH